MKQKVVVIFMFICFICLQLVHYYQCIGHTEKFLNELGVTYTKKLQWLELYNNNKELFNKTAEQMIEWHKPEGTTEYRINLATYNGETYINGLSGGLDNKGELALDKNYQGLFSDNTNNIAFKNNMDYLVGELGIDNIRVKDYLAEDNKLYYYVYFSCGEPYNILTNADWSQGIVYATSNGLEKVNATSIKENSMARLFPKIVAEGGDYIFKYIDKDESSNWGYYCCRRSIYGRSPWLAYYDAIYSNLC